MLSGTPPETIVYDMIETAIRVAGTSWKGRKTIHVFAQIAFARTQRPTGTPAFSSFQIFGSHRTTANRDKQLIPFSFAWNMPALRANTSMLWLYLVSASAGIAACGEIHSSCPVIQMTIPFAILRIIVVTFAARSGVVQIFRHPCLRAYCHGIELSVNRCVVAGAVRRVIAGAGTGTRRRIIAGTGIATAIIVRPRSTGKQKSKAQSHKNKRGKKGFFHTKLQYRKLNKLRF
jgi:hypothetical protein